MKKLEISILIAFIFSVIVSNMLIFFNKCDILKDNVVRIHILANSDSQQDQLLKYRVKDCIASKVFDILKGTKTKKEAKEIIFNNLDYISKISKEKIRKDGYDYGVNVSLTRSYFTTRKYDSFVLPAGIYDALKVEIGEGKGTNWWCVAFPPMCSPIYSNEKDNADILGYEQLKMVQNPCEYKFAIVELILRIKYKIGHDTD